MAVTTQGRYLKDLTKYFDLQRSTVNDRDNSLCRGEVREAIESIYRRDSSYIIFQTVANEEAIKTLPKYAKERPKNSYKDNWKVSKATKKDIENDSDWMLDRHLLGFDRGLMDTYLEALKRVSVRYFGENEYVTFPIVDINSCSFNGSVRHPITHVVNNAKDNKKRFENFIDSLNSDWMLPTLLDIEKNQNYKTAEIRKLKELDINPLVILPDPWDVDSESLVNFIRYFSQFRIDDRESGSDD